MSGVPVRMRNEPDMRTSKPSPSLQPHYKVRLVHPGAILHLASWHEPETRLDAIDAAQIVDADWIADPRYGDTIGFIDWDKVIALTWRYSEGSDAQ